MIAYIVINTWEDSSVDSVWLRKDLAEERAKKCEGWVNEVEISTEAIEAI